MSDYGAQYTARAQRGLEIRLQRLFTEAQSDMLRKLDEFTAKYAEKDKRMLAKLEAGEIDKEKYDRWVAGQVFQGAQWEQKLNDMTDSLSDYYGEALDKIHDKQIDVFSKNSNYQAYCMEHDVGKDFGFDLYDADTVERLVKETPELLPRKIVDRKKHNHWNQGIINNCITQGVIQGESIPKIARRIANTVANADMKSATLYARTAMTSAQNGGRMERLKEAKGMGINVKKQWMATEDGKTRDSHIHLDGQIRDVDKPFKSDYGRIDFPGDFKANPADVYNCRCTLVYVFPEYEDMSQYPDWEEAQKMTYPEWETNKAQASQKKKAEDSKKDNTPKDVTAKYLKKHGEGTVTLDEGYKKKKKNEPERETAQLLSDKVGGHIHVRKESTEPGVRTPDYNWNGKDWELKSTTTTKAAKSAIKSGFGQIQENPGGIILNYKDNEFDLSEVEKIADNLLKNQGKKLDLLVISNDEIVLAKRYK